MTDNSDFRYDIFRAVCVAFAVLLYSLLGMELAQASSLVIGGTLVTSDGVVPHGWMVIEDGIIKAISATKPSVPGSLIIETDEFIFPGFVDLHNHPIYDAFPRWASGRQFSDRYQWRDDKSYKALIADPERDLVASNFCDVDEFVEIKELSGGTTSLLGISKPSNAPSIPQCIVGLARNLDWYSGFHGTSPGNEPIANAIGVTPRDMKDDYAEALQSKLASGTLDLLAVHVAEGKATDAESQTEFALLKSRQLFTSNTAIVHGVALTPNDFIEMHEKGSALIWSPRSNMELYGQTTDVVSAAKNGVLIALAPDWSPTGSTNMLAEISYAARLSKPGAETDPIFSPRQLFEMATSVPAKIAKIDDKVGSIGVGLHADLFFVRSNNSDPYAALTQVKPEDVTLVMVDGTPIYGDEEQLRAAGTINVESVDMCGTARGLNSDTLTTGNFASTSGRLQSLLAKSHVDLAPLAECGTH